MKGEAIIFLLLMVHPAAAAVRRIWQFQVHSAGLRAQQMLLGPNNTAIAMPPKLSFPKS